MARARPNPAVKVSGGKETRLARLGGARDRHQERMGLVLGVIHAEGAELSLLSPRFAASRALPATAVVAQPIQTP